MNLRQGLGRARAATRLNDLEESPEYRGKNGIRRRSSVQLCSEGPKNHDGVSQMAAEGQSWAWEEKSLGRVSMDDREFVEV